MAYTNENQQLMQKLSGEISKVIKGKGEAVQLILTALLAQGHVLIEDVPGVGKTTLAMALGKATGLSFRRAQFTPDVMASGHHRIHDVQPRGEPISSTARVSIIDEYTALPMI